MEPFLIASEQAPLEINMAVFKKNEVSQQHFIKRKIQTLLEKPIQKFSTFLARNKQLEKGSDKKEKTALESARLFSISGIFLALFSFILLLVAAILNGDYLYLLFL